MSTPNSAKIVKPELNLIQEKIESLISQLLNPSYLIICNFDLLHMCKLNPNQNWKSLFYDLLHTLDIPQSWILDLHDFKQKTSKIPNKIQIFFITEHVKTIVEKTLIHYIEHCNEINTYIL